MVGITRPAHETLTALEVAESIRGAVNLVLDELDSIGGPSADLCRYMELADTCPAFASVTSEPPSAAEVLDETWATFTLPILNGPTFRVLVIPVKGS